jgi:hypothetical protein
MGVFTFFTENWQVLGAIVGALLTLASLITALTDTPKDDEWVRKIAGWLSFLQPRSSVGTVKAPLTAPSEPTREHLVTPRSTRPRL